MGLVSGFFSLFICFFSFVFSINLSSCFVDLVLLVFLFSDGFGFFVASRLSHFTVIVHYLSLLLLVTFFSPTLSLRCLCTQWSLGSFLILLDVGPISSSRGLKCGVGLLFAAELLALDGLIGMGTPLASRM